MTHIDSVDQDRHAARLVEDHLEGRITVEQLAKLALAIGRLQGIYMSATQLATEAGLVCEFNSTRRGTNDDK